LNILYIHQYFKTPEEPGGTRSYWVARRLIEEGYRVTIITTTSKNDQLLKKTFVDGIEVIYINIKYDNKMGLIGRFISFTLFMVASSLICLFGRRYNLLVATSTPLTVGIPALLYRAFRSVPYIFEVRDLWPEVPIQMGGLNNYFLRKIAIALEKTVYRFSSRIITLSPGMENGVCHAGVSGEKISMIPNMAKIDKFWPHAKDSILFDKYNIDAQSLNIIHFGAMGVANGLDYILKAASILQTKGVTGISFILLGDGSDNPKLKSQVNDAKLSNIIFINPLPMNETSELVNICDLSIISFANFPILNTNSPNKLFDSLSAGKPIVVNSEGWTKELVERNKCGFYVAKDSPQDLAELLYKLSDKQNTILEYGRNARVLAEEKYDKSILCDKFLDVVESVKSATKAQKSGS